MTTVRSSKNIRIHLENGSLSGSITVSIASWTGEIISVPRDVLLETLNEPDNKSKYDKPGVYVLTGVDIATQRPIAYIGESDNITSRLKTHAQDSKKVFFDRVTVFTHTDDYLTKSHVRYLEHRLIGLATGLASITGWQIENKQGSDSRLPRAEQKDMDETIERLKLLLPMMGLSFLQEPLYPSSPQASAQQEVAPLQLAQPAMATDTESKRFDYWTALNNYLKNKQSSINPQQPPSRHWTNLSIGTSKAHMNFRVLFRENNVACDLYIKDHKALYHFLEQHKGYIEQAIGTPLHWTAQANKKARLITAEKAFALNSPHTWEDSFSYLEAHAIKFKEVLCPLISQFENSTRAEGATTPEVIFELTSNGGLFHAKGYEDNRTFVVMKGSLVRNLYSEDYVNTLAGANRFQKRFLTESSYCEAIPHNTHVVQTTQDITFNSPSSAATFVSGREANGRIGWKVQGSQETYGEWHARQQETPSPSYHEADTSQD